MRRKDREVKKKEGGGGEFVSIVTMSHVTCHMSQVAHLSGPHPLQTMSLLPLLLLLVLSSLIDNSLLQLLRLFGEHGYHVLNGREV